MEDTFSKWLQKQAWRQAMPPVRVLLVPNDAWLAALLWVEVESKERAMPHTAMQFIKLGVFFPHEIFSYLYHFREGELFYGLLTGTPSDA